jgi:YbbR domain-containing protein
MLSQLSENWILKLLSLVFALVLWFFVMGERRQEIGFSVPLKLENIPQDLMLANEVPNLVDVRISGPRTLLMNLSPQDVSISVDLKDLKPGLTSFKRLDEKLNIPSALKVTRLSPSFVDVKLERIKEKQVPVVPSIEGTPAEGYRVEETTLKPSKTIVTGAEGELKDIREVATDSINVTDVTESFSLMVPINYQGKYTRLKQQEAVEVQVTIAAVPPPAAQKSGKASSKVGK